jgi:ribosomal protein S18 acetylase RimI-like enzyme
VPVQIPFPQVTFRRARRQDVPTLLRFIRAYYRHDRRPFNVRTAGTAVRTLLTHPRQGRIWLICDRGKPVGYVVLTFGFSLEFGGREAVLEELYLMPSSRHRGIGACAVSFITSEARLLGMRALHLEVASWNTAARRVYEKAGLRVRERYSLMSQRLSVPRAGRRLRRRTLRHPRPRRLVRRR